MVANYTLKLKRTRGLDKSPVPLVLYSPFKGINFKHIRENQDILTLGDLKKLIGVQENYG